MSVKNYYYIDASVFLEEEFYKVAEKLWANIPDICFVLDSSIEYEIKRYRELGMAEEMLTLASFASLLKGLAGTLTVDTAGGFDPAGLLALGEGNIFVLTQRETQVDNFAALGERGVFLHLENGQLVPFESKMEQNGNAFYLERDVYVNAFDAERLDYVYSPRYGYLKLDKSRELSGGEGICYRTYNGLLCKLYFKKHITYVNYKKLQKMVDMGCSLPYIAWPLDILYYKNQFVGYVMEDLTDTRSIDELRDDGFSGFRLIDRFIIVRNFLRIVEYLHSKNILVGDMKLDNILVKPNGDVYLIDAGSFQVGDYACNVCHKEYTERIYTGDQLKRILRSVKEEYFPINKIIFEVLMMKNPFYSKDNTEIDGDGSREFTYPMDPAALAGESMPYHIKVWFALSPAMREYFYRYFTEHKVTYLSEWLRELEAYILSKQRPASRATQN